MFILNIRFKLLTTYLVLLLIRQIFHNNVQEHFNFLIKVITCSVNLLVTQYDITALISLLRLMYKFIIFGGCVNTKMGFSGRAKLECHLLSLDQTNNQAVVRFRTFLHDTDHISNRSTQNNFLYYLRSTAEGFLFMFIYINLADFIYTRTEEN